MNYEKKILNELHFNSRVQSSALDTDETRALVRAGNEAFEKCASAYQGDEQIVFSSRAELGDKAINPRSIFPQSASGERDDALLLQDNQPIGWTPVWSLTHNTSRMVPAAYCYFGFPQEHLHIQTHSRGLAAGYSLEFCIVNGITELIETLTAYRWKKQGKQAPEVVLSSFEDPLFDMIPKAHSRKGRNLWMLDLAQHTETPFHVFAVFSHAPQQHTLLEGIAASHNPHKAMRSALLECAQMLPNLQLSDEEQTVSQSIAFDVPHYKMPGTTTYGQSYYGRAENSAMSLQTLINRLKSRHIEVLMKDLTRPSVPIHAVRMILSIENL